MASPGLALQAKDMLEGRDCPRVGDQFGEWIARHRPSISTRKRLFFTPEYPRQLGGDSFDNGGIA
jgi:hypothetical protein